MSKCAIPSVGHFTFQFVFHNWYKKGQCPLCLRENKHRHILPTSKNAFGFINLWIGPIHITDIYICMNVGFTLFLACNLHYSMIGHIRIT